MIKDSMNIIPWLDQNLENQLLLDPAVKLVPDSIRYLCRTRSGTAGTAYFFVCSSTQIKR